MKLLINVPLASGQVLIAAGFDALSVGVEHPGVSDREVISVAIKEERTIVTFDRDYGELIFKFGQKPPCGVIYLRWKNFKPNEPGEYLVSLLRTGSINFNHALTVIDKDTIRQRKYT